MKGFKLFALVMLSLVLMSTGVFATHAFGTGANGTDFVEIVRVELNDQELRIDSPTRVELEDEFDVKVFFRGHPNGKCEVGDRNPCYDVYAEAEINGYEYGDVRDVTGPFEVEPGVQDYVTLRLRLPNDLAASDVYSLSIELKDDDDLVLVRYPLRIQEIRHKLNVFDVIFNPVNNIRAGQPLFSTVRVENLGDNKESSIKVTVAVPSLGIQTSEFVDKLLTLQDENDDFYRYADDAATTNDLLLLIPENTPEGDYNVVVTVDYDRGRSVEQKTYRMHILGMQEAVPTTPSGPSVVVNVDAQAQRVEAGKGAVYKFSVANLGQQAATYTFEVLGVSDWASTRTEPTTLVVQPDSTGDAFVYVAPNEDVTGIRTFTVRVKSGANVISEKNLSLEVTGDSTKTDVKTVFTWIFVILLIILVILVIVVIVKNLSSKNKEEGVEGQTYY
ncbi:hypothetical protein J4216_05035 [Candidatus Woesearchaeota archaeon]|nr:hypothetical protein [Candidatus Woesearchaeota archaeon]